MTTQRLTEPGKNIYSAKSIQNPDASEEVYVDIYELFMAFIDHIYQIALCFLIGAILLNTYALFFVKPTYQSTAKMYIVSSSGDSVVDLTDLNIGTSLTSDYQELIMSYPVLNEVIEKLDLDTTYEELGKMIRLENPDNTRVLNITCTSTDRKLARDIANTLMEVSIDYLPKTMSISAPNVAQEARLAERKSGPSYTKYTVIGALAGMLLCMLWILIKLMLDDTIHTQEDLEKTFALTPLSVIPENDVFNRKEGKKDA